MEHRAPSNTSASSAVQSTREVRREGRATWVLTAYGISGLALFGVLLYYFSTYVTH